MKKKLTGGEWLDHFQSKVRIYCGKQMIATVHRVMLLSILTKAWNKAFELGYMEKQKELDKLDTPLFKFVLSCDKCGKSYISDFAFPKEQLCDICMRKEQNDNSELFPTE